MRSWTKVVIAVAVLVLIGIIGLAKWHRSQEPTTSSAPLDAEPYRKQLRAGKPTPPVGAVAVRPVQSGQATIAADDVRAFVTAHPLPRSVNRDNKFTVVRIDFLTSKEVVALLGGASTGFPDNYPLCYVELQGRFTFSGPDGAAATFSKGVEVFDARTGNFLISGGLPSVPPVRVKP